MSDYKRDIYYLYNYENGQKRNNVGFTRVEQMNGKCRMTSRIRVPSMNGKILKVCLFLREQGGMSFLPVGMMKISNMTGESRILLDTGDVMGMGYSLEEMKGMVIYDSLQKFFGSEWDDQRICFEEFRLAEGKKTVVMEEPEEEQERFLVRLPETKCGEEAEEIFKKEEQVLTAASIGVKDGNAREDGFSGSGAYRESDFSENRDAREDGAGFDDCKSLPIEQEEPCSESNVETEEKITEESPRHDLSKHLPEVFYQFPPMYPFEDDEMTDCVRIEPQDIGRLPMESWILANNSFLLHSYYSYRHLLLARRCCNSGYEYVLCVPGICQSREQFMAAMFGFCDFKPVKHVEDKTGEFGYWYMPVIME